MKTVLKHAIDRNLVRQSFHAKHNAFDAWRQMVEVIFAISPADAISVDKKQSIIIEILRELIPKVKYQFNIFPSYFISDLGRIFSKHQSKIEST